jgi:non-heme chloroperoxidase
MRSRLDNAAMPYFQAVDGTQMFYSVWGSASGDPVLLIHGGNVGSDVWDFQIPSLVDKGFRCIVYEQRGFSRSDAPGTGYDFDTFASDLDALIRHLNLDNFSAVGYSHGGCVLARYLANYGSAKVNKAVLVASIAPFLLKTAHNPEGIDRSDLYEPFERSMRIDRPKIFRESLDAFFAPETAETPVSDEIKDWAISVCLRSSLMPMLAIYRAGSETDFRPDMAAFTMPTLILHGDKDPFAPPAITALRTHRLIPGSELVLYEGASHGLFFTHQERLNRDLASFLLNQSPAE